MFLSGALDDVPKKDYAPPPSPMPKSEGLLGVVPELHKDPPLSVRSKMSRTKPRRFSPQGAKTRRKFLIVSKGERSTPPWAASGTPPLVSRPSLRDIQMQQHGKQLQSLSSSPKARTTGLPSLLVRAHLQILRD
ncbi:hypothetical protein Vadar_008308 [Vaccinium darrowii]|uniref:Uncharacterized protein n=1 Tax=Vaccinium darrowii TaxID=229202 RepID=A0ACB7XYZ1_9ERIC|nr:hypothetical protein Vadar_008308 [Vaccinium darrowii]